MRTTKEIRNGEWFGPIPDRWEMKPLKTLFTFSKGLSITKANLTEEGVPVVSYGQIHSKAYEGTGMDESILRYVSEQTVANNTSSQVNEGGFVFADTSEDLDGVGNCAYNDSKANLYGGYHTVVLNPREHDNNKYLAYLFRTDAWRKQLRRQLVDVKLFSITQSILSETYVVLPPPEIRKAIVAYLDARCAPIDEAIARHRAAIGKLEEYRRAVITKAVTKGLGSNVDMKDSGYEWMGTIPVRWSAKRLKVVATRVFDGPFGSHLKNDDYTDAGIRVVRLENLKYLKFDDSKRSYVTEAKYDTIQRHTVFPSDLIMATFVNDEVDVCRLPVECGYAVNKADCVGIRLKRGYIPEFMQYALSANTTYMYLKSLMHGATRGRVNTAQIKSIPIAIPTVEEQLDIVAYLDYQCAAVDDAIDRQNQIISKLEEYRKSLIHAAVTGRIDCTKGVAS